MAHGDVRGGNVSVSSHARPYEDEGDAACPDEGDSQYVVSKLLANLSPVGKGRNAPQIDSPTMSPVRDPQRKQWADSARFGNVYGELEDDNSGGEEDGGGGRPPHSYEADMPGAADASPYTAAPKSRRDWSGRTAVEQSLAADTQWVAASPAKKGRGY